MATSLKAFTDPDLSFVAYNPAFFQKSDGSTGPVDFVLYVGSTLTGKIIKAQSNPGVDAIVLSINDAAGGSGQPTTAIKMALTSAGLASATPGAGLSLGLEIFSGASGAVAVYVRVEASSLTEGTYSDLAIDSNELVESDA